MNRRRRHRDRPRNQRLAQTFYATIGQPCFLTVRAHRHQELFVRPELNAVIVETLLVERTNSRCLLYCYCLMPDHIHLLTAPQEEDASVLKFVDRFKGRSTRSAWTFGLRGRIWQPRSYDHVVRKIESVGRIAEYILKNPVRRRLVEKESDYPWGGIVDPFE